MFSRLNEEVGITSPKVWNLNFTGLSQITDYAFVIMSELFGCNKSGKAKMSGGTGVQNVVLDGCHLITDYGLQKMAVAFPNISQVCLNFIAFFL